MSAVVCAGCGATAPLPYPFRCPNAGQGDTDHVLTVVQAAAGFPTGSEANPFVRYRTLLHAYQVAREHGLSDAAFVDLVEQTDRAIARVSGRGFAATPFFRSAGLSDRLGQSADGGVWLKDETGNVSGSHKGRHLMGLLLYLEVVERTGLAHERPELAIASCGNAALAAAVVARAGGRTLQVFIPESADPAVVTRLQGLGARLVFCPREEGVPGDPTYRRLQQAVRDGALPFTCQGPDNGLTIDGGKTLAYEIVSALGGRRLDRIFIQVGGGALASSVIQGFRDAVRLGALEAMPRVHAVQTRGGYPLKRAYDRVASRILGRLGTDEADRLRAATSEVEEALRYAATHRSEFMWPWEQEPKSFAGGILDDETYDWLAVVRGMLETGGVPVVVSEERVIEANAVARSATGINVDHTGSAGLAGLLALRDQVGPDERVVVLFTGAKR